MSEGINTGMQRAAGLMIEKKINGEYMPGYPRVYRVGSAFQNFTELTDTQLATIPPEEYIARLEAFKLYVESIEQGVIVDIQPAYNENLISCPIA